MILQEMEERFFSRATRRSAWINLQEKSIFLQIGWKWYLQGKASYMFTYCFSFSEMVITDAINTRTA